MTRRVASGGERGFTKWDLLIVVAVVGVLVALLLPALTRIEARSAREGCVNRLKQVGLGFRMWANEWGERLPWQLATTNGGTGGWLEPGDSFRHFRTVSNELTTPKVLVCPDDRTRKYVSRWEDFRNNSHLSYFVGLDADETRPQTMLSGDRSISTNGQFLTGLVLFNINSPIEWAKGIHGAAGNICLGDGSVQQLGQNCLAGQFAGDSNAVVRLLIP